jgi:hypothetical protein
MIQNLTFLFWRGLVREDARPMAEPIRGVWLAERVVAVSLACVLGDLLAHDVVQLAKAERLAHGFGRARSAAGAGNVSARHRAPGIGRGGAGSGAIAASSKDIGCAARAANAPGR